MMKFTLKKCFCIPPKKGYNTTRKKGTKHWQSKRKIMNRIAVVSLNITELDFPTNEGRSSCWLSVLQSLSSPQTYQFEPLFKHNTASQELIKPGQ
jgi:hypothetical protein